MFLSESKSSCDRGDRLKEELSFDHVCCVPSDGKKGGLLLLWKEATSISITSSSEGTLMLQSRMMMDGGDSPSFTVTRLPIKGKTRGSL